MESIALSPVTDFVVEDEPVLMCATISVQVRPNQRNASVQARPHLILIGQYSCVSYCMHSHTSSKMQASCRTRDIVFSVT